MLAIKPFIRITILSLILTSLLIFLGVKYHWGDHLKNKPKASIELSIPVENAKYITDEKVVINDGNVFNPEIIKNNTNDSVLASMNKDQIAEQCINLLSKELKDPLTLELATVNCVVSNHQATFQNAEKPNSQTQAKLDQERIVFKQQCRLQYNSNPQYSALETHLLVGICVSDKVSSH